MRKTLYGVTGALALLLYAVPVHAQATGTIRGVVEDATTGRPVAGAQLQVVGTQRGTLSNTNGQYLIVNVPVGSETVRVTYIGYRSTDQTVDVTAGGTATANFQLTQSAIGLDEIVVTGTAGQTEKRALGNSVGKVETSQLVDDEPISTVNELLTARTPGVSLLNMSGEAGASARVRIRGAGSLSGGLDPVYYVDGVRVSGGVNDGFSTSNGLVQGTSPLDAINPNDIESIEVIKGPAAATLYGAEAAGGVVQIITKKGHTGEGVRFTAELQSGTSDWALDMPTNYTLCTVAADTTALGMSTSQFDSNFGTRIGSSSWPGCDRFTGSEPIQSRILTDQPARRDPQAIRTGYVGGMNFSARGGGDNYTFYFAGEKNNEEGVYYNNFSDRRSVRGNFGFLPSEKLNFQVSSMYARTRVQMPLANNASNGILRNAFRGRPGHSSSLWGEAGIGWHGFIPEVSNQYDNQTWTERTIVSMVTSYTPFPWFHNRVTIGMDKQDRTNQVFYRQDTTGIAPWGDAAASGYMERYLPTTHQWTLDYNGTITNDFTENLGSSFSAGMQLLTRKNEWYEVRGYGLVTDKLNLVGAAANISADQGYQEQTSLGFYGQEQLSWKNRLFATVALRVDDNTAFGSDFSLVYYPKASLSWVISDEPFFHYDFINELKLRAAFGEAGNAPGPGQADRTYQPGSTALNGDVANRIYPNEYGNSKLKAETGREIELGFDASFLDSRLGAEFTYYNQHTVDALVDVSDPPSSGFNGHHYENIGEIANSGIELALNGSPIYKRNVQWDATLSLSTNANKLISFGTNTIQEIAFGAFAHIQKFKEDYPLAGIWSLDVERDAQGNPVLYDAAGNVTTDPKLGSVNVLPDSMMQFVGPSMPTREISFANTLTLFNNLRLFANFDYKGGYYQWCAICSIRSRSNRNTGTINNPNTNPVDRLVEYSLQTKTHIKPADYIKLRELSATYTLPQKWSTMFKSSQTSITVSGRNLWMWTKYFKGFDPEVAFYSRDNFNSTDYASTPMTRRLLITVRFVF
ncbi:MAG: SusC/RagA family TonB-linked outer membrane protein [Gemmatimonadota bacterium]